MIIRIIGAMSKKDHGVGFQNTIPWKQKGDMDRFKKITQEDGVIIMGSRTFDSFHGYVLPKRMHIVLSRDEKISTDERVVYVTSMDEAIELGRRLVSEVRGKGISIIGGSQIWKEGFAYADVLSLSYIDTDESVVYDTFFPDIDMSVWKEGAREKFTKDENNQFDYEFVEYIKK
jgi:dihydrofolate reductase